MKKIWIVSLLIPTMAAQIAEDTSRITYRLDQHKTESAPQQPKDKEQILMRLREMEETFHSEKYAELAGFYSDTAVITGKGVEISGRAAIQKYWKNLEGRGRSWELESTDILGLGEFYLQRGISRMSFNQGDQVVQADSKFSLIWIREKGKWVILLDHYSPLR